MRTLQIILAVIVLISPTTFATKCPAVCIADVDGNGVVNIDDMLGVIGAWGPCAGCPADINGNGVVNIDDLLGVIGAWGACPPLNNDVCAEAALLPPLPVPSMVTGSLQTATVDTAPPCAGVFTGFGRWYTVIGTGALLTASTCDSPFEAWDGALSVYAGVGCGALGCVAASDSLDCGPGGVPGIGLQESVTWPSVLGVKYWILVHSDALPMAPEGHYVLKIF